MQNQNFYLFIKAILYEISLIYLLVFNIYLYIYENNVYLFSYCFLLLISKIVSFCIINIHMICDMYNECLSLIWIFLFNLLQILYLYISVVQIYKLSASNQIINPFIICEFINNLFYLIFINNYYAYNITDEYYDDVINELTISYCCCICGFNIIDTCIYLIYLSVKYIYNKCSCIIILFKNIIKKWFIFIISKCKLKKRKKTNDLAKMSVVNILFTNNYISTNTTNSTNIVINQKNETDHTNESNKTNQTDHTDHTDQTDHTICTICREILSTDYCTLKKCNHQFCKECIEKYFKEYKNECPNCRLKTEIKYTIKL